MLEQYDTKWSALCLILTMAGYYNIIFNSQFSSLLACSWVVPVFFFCMYSCFCFFFLQCVINFSCKKVWSAPIKACSSLWHISDHCSCKRWKQSIDSREAHVQWSNGVGQSRVQDNKLQNTNWPWNTVLFGAFNHWWSSSDGWYRMKQVWKSEDKWQWMRLGG